MSMYKPIRFIEERWNDIKALRDLVVELRHNDNISMPDVVNEAVKHYHAYLKQQSSE